MKNIQNLLVLIVVAIGLTGCAIFNSIVTAGLPTATYLLIKQYPQARTYVLDVATGVSEFSTNTGEALSPDNLRAALIKIPVSGLSPIVLSGVYDIVIAAYTPIYDNYIAGSSNVEKVRASLAAISTGLTNGVAKYDKVYPPVVTTRRGPPVIPQDALRQLAAAMAKAVK